ncbi:MAG: FAD synthetase family protein [Verrucomicrobia bacterium]|nr:FAD synthetase family protein [Verrucomicrobiota bacterium]
MIVVESLEDIPSLSGPIALTIGTYDGVHLGHQYLFHELKKYGTAVVLTFSNHPSEVLRPDAATPLIDTLEQKLRRFENNGIDLVIALPFTSELSSLAYDTFIQQIRQHLPFTHLILGEGAVIGHQAQGNEKNIQALAQELHFKALYLPKFTLDGEVVSSRRIRHLIETGNFEQAFRLLGRPQTKSHQLW